MKVLLNLSDGRVVAVLDAKELPLFAAVPPDEGRTYAAQTAVAIADAKQAIATMLAQANVASGAGLVTVQG